MPFAVIIGVGAVALLSGPICGGVRWHVWNREHGRNPLIYRHAEDRRAKSILRTKKTA